MSDCNYKNLQTITYIQPIPMENDEYKVFYVNTVTGEKVAFNHAMPVRFNKEQVERFIKNTNYDRWYGGGTLLPNHWQMKALKVELLEK